jgi:hypothetical protein
MSTSAARSLVVSGPGDWPPILNSPSTPLTRPIGVTTAAVPHANASFSRPLSASAFHWSIA